MALTFDDGPTTDGTGHILEMLEDHSVRATFFLMGSSIEANPEAARALVAAGHEIGNHTYSHDRMVLKSHAFVKQEIEATDRLIRSVGYTGDIHFRAPYSHKFVMLPWYLSRTGRKHIS